MNLWNLRGQAKQRLSLGTWTGGKMTRSAFPLSKAASKFYRLGALWTWRVITFESGGSNYRILVAYRTDKEQFQALLGLDVAGDTKVVARLEFHGTHGAWHLHYASEPLGVVPSGIRSGPWVRRHECKKHGTFGLSGTGAESKAMTIVADIFGLHSESGGLV
jgi:hypothetical protein